MVKIDKIQRKNSPKSDKIQGNNQKTITITDCWLLITDCWLLIADYWLLIADYWLLITDLHEGASRLCVNFSIE